MAKDPFVKKIYKVDNIQVYPMLFEDSEIVSEHFAKFNPDAIGYAVLMSESKEAVLEIMKLATQLPEEQIGKINVCQMQEIIDEYIGVSKLKKKMET